MFEDPLGEKAALRASSPPAPEAEEEPPALDPKVRNARIASAAVVFAVAAAEFSSVVLTKDLVVASIWAIFGFISLATGVYLYRGRFTAWGTAIIVNTFTLLLAIVTVDLYVIAVLVASFVVLYVFRLPFGVGAWKIEAEEQNVRARELITERTRVPAGLRCPKCGSEALWLADDGSAFCLSCRAGTIELADREPA